MPLLANQNENLILILVGIAVLVVFGAFALVLFRSFESLARRSLSRQYAGLQVHQTPVEGDVIITYHTYHGLFVWFTQTPHAVALPPDQARILLRRLLQFNLAWGTITYGALFIPPLALWNYYIQRWSISAQEAEAAFTVVAAREASDDAAMNLDPSAQSANADRILSRSLFHRVIGWACAVLCLIFGITTVVCFARAEFEPAVGGLFATAILGWTSWNWIGSGDPG